MKQNSKKRLSETPKYLEGRVGRVLPRMAVPQIAGGLGLLLYNLVDTFYIGRLGRTELAAISFTFPVVMIVGSLAQGIAQGSSIHISRMIGGGDLDAARRLSTHALVLAFAVVCVIVVVGLATIDPLFRLLGAQDDVLPFIREYMQIWYPAVMLIIVTMVGNHILRSTGEVKIPSIIMLVASGLNALLDPVFIFGFGPVPAMGMRGAAIATAIARSLTLIVAFWLLVFRERLVRFGRGSLERLFESWRDILKMSVPIAGSRLIIPLGAGLVTRIIAEYGTAAVAGYGVASRIESLSLTFVQSFAVIVGPFVGQNIGAGRVDRVREAYSVSYRYCFIVGVISFLMLVLFAVPLAKLFNQDPVVVSTAALYLRIVSSAFAFHGVYLVIVAGLNVLKRPYSAAGISLLQMFGFTVPFVLLFSTLFGMPGVFSGVALSYCAAGITAYAVMKKVLAELPGRNGLPNG